METTLLSQPNQGVTFTDTAEELVGTLEIPDRAVIGGGYAEIYHGFWTTPQGERVEVAIKVLKALLPRTRNCDHDSLVQRAEKRIKREVFYWSQTKHPNLHPLLGYRLQPQPQLVSPWCHHGDLGEYLNRNPGLPRSKRLQLVHQAGCGLGHLHSRSPPVCHADIKPGNVLINDLGQAALSDFGLSRAVTDISSGFTTSEMVYGTPAYMAIELSSGEKPSCQSDVYAFGGLILTVMSNQAPFHGLQPAAIVFRQIQNELPRPKDHPDLPAQDPLWKLMRRCWNPIAAERPTIHEVLIELEEDIRRERPQQESNRSLDEDWGPVTTAVTANTDTFETASGDTITPHSIVVGPPSPTPHTVVDNVKLPKTPAKGPLQPPQPLLHPRQRNIFGRLDSIFKFRLHSRASSSLKHSLSVESLPISTDSDIYTPHPSNHPLSRNLRRLSLNELRDGFLSINGKRSKNLDALDYTGQLSERTKTKSTGGFSDISQARLGDRVVAVKALKATNADGPDEIRMRKRLAREIYVWAALDHPHVLEFLGFAFEDSTPCLISPWCENGTLQEYLQKSPNANRRLLVRQIAEGLKYLHDQIPPVIHGDFKPANILVTDQHMAMICDFGGSKRLGQIKTGFTTTGLVLCPIRYCAPETLREGRDHTLNSDVYSFAGVALETMTDKSPFWRIQNLVGVISRVVFEKQTPSPEDHPGLEDGVWELLRRCWNQEPLDRPEMFDVCKKLAEEGYGLRLSSI